MSTAVNTDGTRPAVYPVTYYPGALNTASARVVETRAGQETANIDIRMAKPVRLDLERLAAIAAATPVPLVLHGASGLPAEDLLGAVELGVVKVNVNAELRRAYFGALDADVGDDIRKLQGIAIEAMAAVAGEKIELLARRV